MKLRVVLMVILGVSAYLLGRMQAISDTPHVQLVSVHDGDTIIVNITNWPDIIGRRIPIRIKGIDAPELHDESERVRHLAEKSKEFLSTKIGNSRIVLQDLERDKYFRINANVYVRGRDVGQALILSGYAKQYDGGKKPVWK